MTVHGPFTGNTYHLNMRGALHIGELGIGREETLAYMPSDTLYAALVSAWVALGQTGPFDPPAVQITSAFPRVGEVRLYPRPHLRVNVQREVRDRLGKTLLKLRWCSERIFVKLVNGEDLTDAATEENIVAGAWFSPEDQRPLLEGRQKTYWAKSVTPRVSLDRARSSSNLFHIGRTAFGPDCGLWFGVRFRTADAEGRFNTALDYLADSGIGGLRSVGHGAFDHQPGPVFEDRPRANSPYCVTLSRFLPAGADEVQATLKAERAAYSLVFVGGWCQDDAGHDWRRKRVRFVREGSVICLGETAGGIEPGYIANVRPDHIGAFHDRPVLRYGLPFPVSVREEALL